MKIKLPDFESTPTGATFSPDRAHRYLLWRTFETGKDILLIIALNPSTADESVNDPTITRCIGFAKTWGFKTLVVANIFSFRATRPTDLKLADDPVGELNDVYLKELSKNAGCTLVAWGVHGEHLGRGRKVCSFFKEPKCLGITKHGHPRHPLYVAANRQRVDYR